MARQVEGFIGYFELADWWFSAFTEEERAYIEDLYKPFMIGNGVVSSRSKLTEARITFSTGTATGFLNGLSSWFRHRPEDRYLARLILTKAEELSDRDHLIDKHLCLSNTIELYYKDRNDPDTMALFKHYCHKQIALAPQAADAFHQEYPNRPLPHHMGYERLIMVNKIQKNYVEAIKLAEQAKSQGWSGYWDAIISQCTERMTKISQNTKHQQN